MIALTPVALVMHGNDNGAISFSTRELSCKQSSEMIIFLSGLDAAFDLRTVSFSLQQFIIGWFPKKRQRGSMVITCAPRRRRSCL